MTSLLDTPLLYVQDYGPLLRDALKRGVSIQILVMDPSTENGDVLSLHIDASNRGGRLEQLRQRINQTISSVNSLRAEGIQAQYKGSIEIRTLRGLMLHSMWIRDGSLSDGNPLAHLGYYWHRGSEYAPSLRVSGKTSPKLVENAKQEFAAMWTAASPVPSK